MSLVPNVGEGHEKKRADLAPDLHDTHLNFPSQGEIGVVTRRYHQLIHFQVSFSIASIFFSLSQKEMAVVSLRHQLLFTINIIF